MNDQLVPFFLSQLDKEPDAAFKDFYLFAVRLLRSCPPRPMRSLNEDDCQDAIHDIIYHCVKDDFRILRQYVSKGRPFAAWFYALAHNKCIDIIRSKGHQPEGLSIHPDKDESELMNLLPDPGENEGKRFELSDLLSIVKKALTLLGDYCRLLLEMAGDEFTPREMVAVLRLPAEQNKKVSDDLRECRRRLRRKLSEDGIDIESLFKD